MRAVRRLLRPAPRATPSGEGQAAALHYRGRGVNYGGRRRSAASAPAAAPSTSCPTRLAGKKFACRTCRRRLQVPPPAPRVPTAGPAPRPAPGCGPRSLAAPWSSSSAASRSFGCPTAIGRRQRGRIVPVRPRPPTLRRPWPRRPTTSSRRTATAATARTAPSRAASTTSSTATSSSPAEGRPRQADESPLYEQGRRTARCRRPTRAAAPPTTSPSSSSGSRPAPRGADAGRPRRFVTEADVLALILADLRRWTERGRRFARYFTLVAPGTTPASADDELQTYRNGLAKLVNSLSWQPRSHRAEGDRPGAARSSASTCATTCGRRRPGTASWPTIPTASLRRRRPQDVLAATGTRAAAACAPTGSSPPPRGRRCITTCCNCRRPSRSWRSSCASTWPRTSAGAVARAGFNGSGVSRNNRILERHDVVLRRRTGRATTSRGNTRPAEPLRLPARPRHGDDLFQHAGGEIIFNLPNGLQAYMLVNGNGQRIDKAPTAIVSDPKRPDRRSRTASRACRATHRGINPKDDQIRDYVDKNPESILEKRRRVDPCTCTPPAKKMRALMDEDAERFRRRWRRPATRPAPSSRS